MNLPLPLDDYSRYGRQMILDGFGLEGQLKLQAASVVVVGAGGLGCPSLQYLAAAGVGRLGIVDHDVVESSNLQRQILHSEASVGMLKAESAAAAIKRLNARTKVDVHPVALNPTNAMSLLANYDIILDCTDNAPTRYLLSDTAVRLGKPLVSGAAQKYDGQLCTYNLDIGNAESPERGSCYRCLFPKPVAPEMRGSCSETGILGAVTGVIGTLQALEAIKLITGLHGNVDRRPTMLIYSALAFPPFRSVKVRSRKKTCPACGDEGEKIGEISETDYVAFCGGESPNWEELGLKVNPGSARIRPSELQELLGTASLSTRILDVRPRIEFGICHLPSSINIPLPDLLADPSAHLTRQNFDRTIVVCRLGNDSQIAVDALREAVGDSESSASIFDLVGGLRRWSIDIDSNFPVY